MPEAQREISIAEIVDQLHALGVEPGDVALVHTSFRAVRPVERGPAGLIEALGRAIGVGGTLVMPSWTGDDDQPFDPTTTAPDLGVLADTFWKLPSVQRSDHPLAFAAQGPNAAPILSGPMVLPPHRHDSAVGKVLEHDGRILLLGVNHDANTTLHLAELLAGVSYGVPKHITVLRGSQPMRLDYLENDHCARLFVLADEWMRRNGLQSEGLVGHAPSKLMRSRDLVDTALAYLEADPFVFLHRRDSDCEACARAWRTVPSQNV